MPPPLTVELTMLRGTPVAAATSMEEVRTKEVGGGAGVLHRGAMGGGQSGIRTGGNCPEEDRVL